MPRIFIDLPLHTHEDCKTVWLARNVFEGEVWEARYCYDHDLTYKNLVKPPIKDEE